MARARKCDRCGKLYEPKSAPIKHFNSGGKSNGIHLVDKSLDNKYFTVACIDLCPECLEDLSIWLNMKNNKEACL